MLFFVVVFSNGHIKETNSLKSRVSCLCMYVLFYVCAGIGFVDLT